MSMSLMEMLEAQASNGITKDEFGRIMHDPNSSDEDIADALRKLEDAGGYENLED